MAFYGLKKKTVTFTLMAVASAFLMTGCGMGSQSAGNDSQNTSVESSTASAADAQVTTDDTTEYSQDVYAMDTYMTVTAYGAESEEAVTKAVEEINRLDNMWSVGNADSEVALVNKNGSGTLSPETGALVEESLELYKETDGAFDITIYPLMVEWGFTTQDYKVPSQATIDELLQYVDAGAVEYDKDTQTITLPDHVQIDLGGIAKGYTSAHIMDIFSQYDVVSGLVSLGGNVQTYHKKVDGSNWRVGVENPDNTVGQLKNADYLGVLQVSDKAVITSGGYERYFEEDGKRYHHILDPSTGYPAESGLISVTIVSDDGCLADGLSTSLFVMGKDKAIDFWREHSDEFDAVLVDDEGNITITSGLEGIFSSDLEFDVVK